MKNKNQTCHIVFKLCLHVQCLHIKIVHTIQREWSLLREVFQLLCTRWHQPQIGLFAMRFNNKLACFVSPVPDPLAWAVDALSLSWEYLDQCAFQE